MAIVNGTAGSNTLNGSGGVDTIYGYAGNDKLHGLFGSDALFGGDGNDRLYGDAGNDSLTGGKGADNYYFTVSSGNDVVSDLNPSEGDKIVLTGVTVDHLSYNPFFNQTTLYFDPWGQDKVTFLSASKLDVISSIIFAPTYDWA